VISEVHKNNNSSSINVFEWNKGTFDIDNKPDQQQQLSSILVVNDSFSIMQRKNDQVNNLFFESPLSK
jgi:hypothetical protein